MKLFKSFKCAIKGILYTLKNERHMRFHIVASIFVFILSLFFDLSVERYLILILTVSIVMISEIINSSLESVIDIFAQDYNSNAKIAKDMAAGAVFLAATASVIVAIIMFNELNAYVNMFYFFVSHPLALIFLIFLAILSYFYIFWGPTEIRNYINGIIKNLKNK